MRHVRHNAASPVSVFGRRFGALGLLLLLAGFAGASDYSFDGVSRIVALSDPHGAYDAMRQTLANADVVDEAGDWAGGDTHLVITGDLLDRGADSRKVMDFVRQMEAQAPEAGGRVHLLLGNHEVMNLVGDLRYVAEGEYAAFMDEESAEDREHWFRIHAAAQLSTGLAESAMRDAFDQDRPPGFFGHRKAFGSQGDYGAWLLQKPLVVVINGFAFTHGGLSPLVTELGLDGLNEKLGNDVEEYLVNLEILYESGLIDPAVNFYEQARLAESLATMTTLEPAVGTALARVMELAASDVHGPAGPLWYRGNVGCNTLVEGDRLDAALAAIGAERVVIGHTPTLTRGVLQRHDGRVIEIDTGMLNSAYRGAGHALIIEGDELWVASEHTKDLTRVAPHPRRVGIRPGNLSAEALGNLLATGDIASNSVDESGRQLVEVTDGRHKVTAVFTEDENRHGVNPELAAYRLDLLLGLEMVPVTVAREIDGDRGALQFRPGNVTDEQQRSASQRGAGAWCDLPDQWSAMYVYDALIHNPGRPPTSMLYSVDNWQIILPGNGETLGTRRGRPRYLEQVELALTGVWRERLAALDEAALERAMDGALDRRRISALLKRRDGLLEGD